MRLALVIGESATFTKLLGEDGGRFLRRDASSPVAYGGTFSKFESWTSRTPDEHVGDLQALLKDWAEYREKEAKP